MIFPGVGSDDILVWHDQMQYLLRGMQLSEIGPNTGQSDGFLLSTKLRIIDRLVFCMTYVFGVL